MVAFTHMGWQKMMGVGGGDAADDLLFNALNPRPDGTISIEPYKGEGSATFTRSTVGDFVIDSDGVYRGVTANEARIQGARRVENRLKYSQLFDDSSWVKEGSTTAIGTSVSFVAGTIGTNRLYQFNARLTGKTYVVSIIVPPSSAWSDDTATLTMYENAKGGTKSITATSFEQRITTEYTASTSGNTAYIMYADKAVTVEGLKFQVEHVSGQDNTAPSEYIPTTSAAVAKSYWKTNGNSVASNVVTEAVGIPLHRVVAKQGANTFARPDTRENSTAYVVGDYMIPATGSGTSGGNGYEYQVTAITTGTSGGSPPTFPETIGDTVVDGGITIKNTGHHKLAGYKGEPAAENVILQSREFDTIWTELGTPMNNANTAQDQVGFDGVANKAWTLEDDDVTASEGIRQDVTIPDDSNPHTESWFILKDSDTTRFPEFQLRLQGGTLQTISTQVNTQTGAKNDTVSIGTTSSSVEDLGLFWRLSLTVTNNGTANVTARSNAYFAYAASLGGANDTSLTGTIVLDQAQLELNTSVPSSPIVTTTASVTRAADDLSYQASGNLVDAAGTILCSVRTDDWALANNSGRIIGTESVETLLTYETVLRVVSYDGTTQINGVTDASFANNKSVGVSARWAGSIAQVCSNGNSSSEGAYDGAWGATSLHILNNNATSDFLQSTISDIRIYKKDLGQTVCEGLTSYD